MKSLIDRIDWWHVAGLALCVLSGLVAVKFLTVVVGTVVGLLAKAGAL